MPTGFTAVTPSDGTSARRVPRAWVLLCTLPIAFGLVTTWRAAWVCDDAFISFRYIDQLEHGHGLVYNAGERVEGYTHFLWLVLLAALHKIGFDLVDLGRYLPILFYAALLAVLFARALRRAGETGKCLPLAAWCVALHPDLQAFGSGGLETAAFTLCVTLAVLAASAERLRPGRVAVACALGALFRPEGVLVAATLGACLLWRRCGWRSLVSFAGVFAALVLPLFLWRWFYYHDWLPNTYYAKSASRGHWDQGWQYLRLYIAVYPILVAAFVVAVAGGVTAVRRGHSNATLFGTILCVVMLVYVLRLGGDFMFARFLLPVTPLLYLALEDTLRGRGRSVVLTGTAIAIAGTVLARIPHDWIFPTGKPVHGIADERRVYGPGSVETRRRQGADLAALFEDSEARFCIRGGQASLAYFGHLPYVLEQYGLTDRELARRAVSHRGRPGHERIAMDPDLLARGVNFRFRAATDSTPGELDEIQLHDLRATILIYDRALMDRLRGRPGVRFVDYPAYLDAFLANLNQVPAEEQRAVWSFFQMYYFSHNADPERLARARAAFQHAGILVEGGDVAPPDSSARGATGR